MPSSITSSSSHIQVKQRQLDKAEGKSVLASWSSSIIGPKFIESGGLLTTKSINPPYPLSQMNGLISKSNELRDWKFNSKLLSNLCNFFRFSATIWLLHLLIILNHYSNYPNNTPILKLLLGSFRYWPIFQPSLKVA